MLSIAVIVMTIINVADAGLHGVGMFGQCAQPTCGQDQPFQGRRPHSRQGLYGPILCLHQKVTLRFILLQHIQTLKQVDVMKQKYLGTLYYTYLNK